MPKSEYPENVQNLPKNKYEQWTAVYHSARDKGDTKETAAKKAWGAVNESKTSLKFSKSSLKEMIRKIVKTQLTESAIDKRIRQLDRYKIESSLSYLDLLEDIVEQMDDNTWNVVLEGLKKKYGYRP